MIFFIVLFVAILALYPIFPFHLIYQAYSIGLKLNLLQLVSLKFIGIPPAKIVRPLIRAHQAQLEKISISDLSSHMLAGGNIDILIDGLITAKNSGVPLSYRLGLAIDLAGRNLLLEVAKCSESSATDKFLIESSTADSTRILSKITLQTHLNIEKVVGGFDKQELLEKLKSDLTELIENCPTKTDLNQQFTRQLNVKTLNETYRGSSYDIESISFTL